MMYLLSFRLGKWGTNKLVQKIYGKWCSLLKVVAVPIQSIMKLLDQRDMEARIRSTYPKLWWQIRLQAASTDFLLSYLFFAGSPRNYIFLIKLLLALSIVSRCWLGGREGGRQLPDVMFCKFDISRIYSEWKVSKSQVVFPLWCGSVCSSRSLLVFEKSSLALPRTSFDRRATATQFSRPGYYCLRKIPLVVIVGFEIIGSDLGCGFW